MAVVPVSSAIKTEGSLANKTVVTLTCKIVLTPLSLVISDVSASFAGESHGVLNSQSAEQRLDMHGDGRRSMEHGQTV